MTVALGQRVDGAASFLRSIYRIFTDEQISFMAKSVAYSAFVSLLPLLLLSIVVAGIVGGEELVASVLAITESYLTPTAQEMLSEALSNASGQFGFSLLGIAALLWGVLNVFRGLDTAFSALYDTQSANGLLTQVKDGLVVLGAITVAVAASVAVGLVVAFVPEIPFAGLLNVAVLVSGLFLTFLPMYYVFPNADVSLSEVLPGTLVAAVGWTVLQGLFGLYVSYSSASEIYGAIGGIILLVTWLYFGAVVLLLGAATNVVLAGRNRVTVARPGDD